MSSKKVNGFTDEERAAMKACSREIKADKADGESEVLAKIAEMVEPDRTMATAAPCNHQNASALMPKTWYGMPAYAKDDKVVCFFQCA